MYIGLQGPRRQTQAGSQAPKRHPWSRRTWWQTFFSNIALAVPMLHWHETNDLVQALTSNLWFTKLLYNLLQYIFHSFVSLLPSHTASFNLANYNNPLLYILMQSLTYHSYSSKFSHYVYQYILIQIVNSHIIQLTLINLASNIFAKHLNLTARSNYSSSSFLFFTQCS